jgi:glycine betaine/choline ABC-type transport system substrate-binding protein
VNQEPRTDPVNVAHPNNNPRGSSQTIRGLSFILIALLTACGPSRQNRIVVGSKNFTEQLILGELIAQQIEIKTHLPVERRFYLAGTFICQQAILAGRIDIYPEYTGTALTAKKSTAKSKQSMRNNSIWKWARHSDSTTRSR